MKFVIQVVQQANVMVDSKIIGEIGTGFLVLIGISETDTKEVADKMIKKLLGMRIFQDDNGKTNLDLKAVDGELLLVSQFTLYADCRHGNRPGFTRAARADKAIPLYEYIISECKTSVETVETGKFGADMKVSLLNDGPFTIILDSEELGY